MLLPLWDPVIVLCFVVRYFVPIIVLQSSSWGRESWLVGFFVFLMSRDCCCSFSSATGLSAVCDCRISSYYFLLFWFTLKLQDGVSGHRFNDDTDLNC